MFFPVPITLLYKGDNYLMFLNDDLLKKKKNKAKNTLQKVVLNNFSSHVLQT